MDTSIPAALSHLGIGVGFFFAITKFFKEIEEGFNPDTKKSLSRWLQNLHSSGEEPTWTQIFVEVFDHVFTKHHLSWRCFLRSCLASLAAVAIVTVIWAALRPAEFKEFLYLDFYIALPTGPPSTDPWFIAIIFLIAAYVNLVPDYISLLESRYILRWMTYAGTTPAILGLLAIDFIATVVISLAAFWTFLFVGFGRDPVWSFLFIRDLLLESRGFPFSFDSLPIGIWFYSAFFTSVWVWLYAFSGLVLKLVSYLRILVGYSAKILDLETKPLQSMGRVSGLVVAFLYWIGLGFRWIFS